MRLMLELDRAAIGNTLFEDQRYADMQYRPPREIFTNAPDHAASVMREASSASRR